MTIFPIKSEVDYNQTLERIAMLMDSQPNTPEGDELDILTTLVEKYEERHFAISTPDPIEAIRFRMEQMGLSQKDLIHILGSPSKVSEVLNHKRPLSLTMIKNVYRELHIPLEVMISA